MKKVLALFLGLPLLVLAEKPPRGTYLSSEFEQARAVAKSEGKALIFIETDSETTCPKTQWATGEAYDQLKRKYVLVVKDKSNSECEDVPAMFKAIRKTSEIGNFSPRITVVEPVDLKFITGINYSNMASDKRWDRSLAAAVEKSFEAPVEETEKAAGETKPEMREWTNARGKTISAAVVASNTETVTFRLEDGKTVDYPVKSLSAESRESLAGSE